MKWGKLITLVIGTYLLIGSAAAQLYDDPFKSATDYFANKTQELNSSSSSAGDFFNAYIGYLGAQKDLLNREVNSLKNINFNSLGGSGNNGMGGGSGIMFGRFCATPNPIPYTIGAIMNGLIGVSHDAADMYETKHYYKTLRARDKQYLLTTENMYHDATKLAFLNGTGGPMLPWEAEDPEIAYYASINRSPDGMQALMAREFASTISNGMGGSGNLGFMGSRAAWESSMSRSGWYTGSSSGMTTMTGSNRGV
ncbi:MAG: hypothetical protein JXA66_05810 [Oligoflexia bacterium]|nr:hypothetical protein [Oligoflexia bacterium]